VPSHGRNISEDGRDVKHSVLCVPVLHEIKLVAVPTLEPLFELIEDFRRSWLDDDPSLSPFGRDACVIRLESFRERAEALEAAGLRDQ
jgi:hypothetical protein